MLANSIYVTGARVVHIIILLWWEFHFVLHRIGADAKSERWLLTKNNMDIGLFTKPINQYRYIS